MVNCAVSPSSGGCLCCVRVGVDEGRGGAVLEWVLVLMKPLSITFTFALHSARVRSATFGVTSRALEQHLCMCDETRLRSVSSPPASQRTHICRLISQMSNARMPPSPNDIGPPTWYFSSDG